MKRYVYADGLIWVLLGIGICIGSIKLKVGDFHTPGAGFLPFFSGALLAIFGLVLMLSAIFSQTMKERRMLHQSESLQQRWGRFLNPLLTVVILFGYILLLNPLGFLLTTFICLLLLFKLSEPRRWVTPILLSVVTAFLSYLVFSVWLQCQLPKGVIRFW
jgi:putative tricarboxylic transport membrane protein